MPDSTRAPSAARRAVSFARAVSRHARRRAIIVPWPRRRYRFVGASGAGRDASALSRIYRDPVRSRTREGAGRVADQTHFSLHLTFATHNRFTRASKAIQFGARSTSAQTDRVAFATSPVRLAPFERLPSPRETRPPTGVGRTLFVAEARTARATSVVPIQTASIWAINRSSVAPIALVLRTVAPSASAPARPHKPGQPGTLTVNGQGDAGLITETFTVPLTTADIPRVVQQVVTEVDRRVTATRERRGLTA